MPKNLPIAKTKFSITLLLMVSLLGCGTASTPEFHSLVEQQPYVLSISPKQNTILEEPVHFVLHFSHRIDLSQVNSESVVLLSGEIDPDLMKDTKSLVKELVNKSLDQEEVQFFMEDDETLLTILPDRPLADGLYHLVVTPLLRSTQGVPFNQTPGKNPTAFIASFGIGENIVLSPSSEDLAELEPSFGPEPESLVLNEFLYDGLSSETDGEAFVELYGTPESDISLYEVSLINGANGEETDRIVLPMGTLLPEDGLFVIADLRTNSKTQTKVGNFDYLDQFDPQNGPDAVHLLNREGVILDRLLYGEGAVEEGADGQALGEGEPAIDVPGGHSLSRVGGWDSQDNSLDFMELEAPTPGVL